MVISNATPMMMVARRCSRATIRKLGAIQTKARNSNNHRSFLILQYYISISAKPKKAVQLRGAEVSFLKFLFIKFDYFILLTRKISPKVEMTAFC